MGDLASVGAYPDPKLGKNKGYFRSNLRKYRALYLMSIPGILFFIVFKYVPLLGNIVAFQDYNIFKGVLGSEFVGLKHFVLLFNYYDFLRILKNTMLISIYDIVFAFPAPLILALMINEISGVKFKRFVQQTVYLPHFLSWTVLGGIITLQLLSPSQGLLNIFLKSIGQDSIYFIIRPELARGIIVLAGIWRDMGWYLIIYLAAIATISPHLYESANIDGAGRVRQLFAITLPSLLPVITVLFLLRIGHFLDFGFERVWVLRNAANQTTSEIFDTYIYYAGLLQGRFSYTTAVGVFKSVVGMALLMAGNKMSSKFTGESLY